jgi:hypothetical protein
MAARVKEEGSQQLGRRLLFKSCCLNRVQVKYGGKGSVVDPYSFFTDPDPDPELDVGDQYGYGYGYGSGSNPIRIQGFNDQKLKKNHS